MPLIDREGTFRAEIADYGLKEQESGAVAVTIRCELTEKWGEGDEAEGWTDWGQYDVEAFGDIYIVKKDKTINKNQVDALIKYAGWDGSLQSISDKTWQPIPCQVVIKGDEYNGETRYKISWVNDFNRTPGELGSITPDKVKALEQRFGGELRALAGNSKLNAARPSGRPTIPPGSKPALPARPASTSRKDPNDDFQEALNASAGAEDIPFVWLLPFVLTALTFGQSLV